MGGIQPGASIEETRERMLDEIYSSGMFDLAGLRLGPYGPDCDANMAGCQCNQGMRMVFLTAPTGGTTAWGSPEFHLSNEDTLIISKCNENAFPKPEDERALVFAQSAATTGGASYLGIGMERGIRAAFEEYNAQGGWRGRRVVLVTYDDGYVPERTVANVDHILKAYNPFAFLGITGTSTTLSILDTTVAAKVPVVGAYTGARDLRSPPDEHVVNVRASCVYSARARPRPAHRPCPRHSWPRSRAARPHADMTTRLRRW